MKMALPRGKVAAKHKIYKHFLQIRHSFALKWHPFPSRPSSCFSHFCHNLNFSTKWKETSHYIRCVFLPSCFSHTIFTRLVASNKLSVCALGNESTVQEEPWAQWDNDDPMKMTVLTVVPLSGICQMSSVCRTMLFKSAARVRCASAKKKIQNIFKFVGVFFFCSVID